MECTEEPNPSIEDSISDVIRRDFSSHAQVDRSRRLYNALHTAVDTDNEFPNGLMFSRSRYLYRHQIEEALQSGPAPAPRRCGFCRSHDRGAGTTWDACWCVASSTLWDYKNEGLVDLRGGFSRWLTHLPPTFASETIVCLGVGRLQRFFGTRDPRIIDTFFGPPSAENTVNYHAFAATIQRGYRAWIRRRAIHHLNLCTPIPSAVIQFVVSVYL
jgi:hypothetical protein